MSEKVTAEMIRKALQDKYTTPEWYLAFEVGNSTGMDCSRHADAVAVNAYPSKGFETRGFEIKVSKSDLKSELENGIKSDEIARFCDYWFLVVPKGLTDDFTLPPTWGVIEYDGGTLRQKIKAARLEKIMPTTGFLCAMLRGRERILSANAARITAEREAQILRDAQWRAGNAEKDLKILHEKLAEINEATGIELNRWTPTDTIIHRLKAARSLELIARNVRHLRYTADALTKDAAEIQAAIDEIRTGEMEEKNHAE